MYNEHERTQRAWDEHLKTEHDEPGSLPSRDCDACAWYAEELRAEYGNQIECMWFIGRRLQRKRFPPQALNLVPEGAPSDMAAMSEEEPDCIPF